MGANDLNIPDEQRCRQAVASLGGYAHQLFSTLKAWMRIASDEELIVEVAEDYAVLSSGALTMTQVKRETVATSLTLNREDARKAILSLWQFGEANTERDVQLYFLTTAPAGKERNVKFPDDVGGIKYWAKAAIGQEVTPLRQFLLHLDWPPELAAFLAEVDDETLRTRLLKRLVWLTGTERTEVLIEMLSSRLELLAIERGLPPSVGARALPQLLLDLLQIVQSNDRRLSRLDFERSWEKATTVAVPISFAHMMGGAIMGTGPDYGEFALELLPERSSLRTGMVDRLQAIIQSGAVPWIHGSSGLGKSRLAALLATRWSGLWHIVRLRGLSPAEVRQTLRHAVAALDRPGLAGVVLDDLPIPLVEPWRRFIGPIATEAARLGLALVVTCERAPLAPAAEEFAPWQLDPVVAPYLDITEVSEIVCGAGGDPEFWAQILHLTCGGGHPLFVDARIAGLASRGWPREERLAGLLNKELVGELDDVRAGVALRLLDELDSEAHTLLLRLSILIDSFDRELVMAVAETHQPLKRAGVLLDFLIGPWIESAGRNRLKLSPLLASAGTVGLGDAECNAVRSAVVENLLARSSLDADLLSQLLIQSVMVRQLHGLKFIAGAILTADNRRAVASACVPLAFLMSKDGRLVPEHPGISASLRLAQVIAVTVEPSHPALINVLEEADAEFEAMPEPIRSGSKFTMLLALLSSEEVRISPALWIPRLLEFVAITEAGLVPHELAEGIGQTDMGGLTEDQFFFVLRSNRIESLGELDELFRLLSEVDSSRRRSWLAASTSLLGGPPLFIQSVWSNLAMKGQLDAIAAVEIYRRLAELAEEWNEHAAAVECHRAAAVVLDEYIDDKEGAITQLDAAAVLHPDDTRIARTRAGVLANANRHREASELLTQIRNDYSVDEPLERAMMLQAAANSTAKAGDRRKAAALFLEAYAASEGADSLEPGIRVGLLCDAAVEFGTEKDWSAALAILGDAHLAAEALVDDSSDRSWLAIQAVSQVAQWLHATYEGRSALLLQDNPGRWSLLKPNIPEDRTGNVRLDTGLARAAILEARLGNSNALANRFSERERDGLVTPLSALALRGGQLAIAIDRRDVALLVEIIPLFVAASRVALEAKSSGKLTENASITVTPAERWNEAEWQTAQQVMSELLAELILDRDPIALKSATDYLLAPGSYLQHPFRRTYVSQDYVAQALQALEYLTTKGFPDPVSLVCATIKLFQWLSVSSRSTLRKRVWQNLCIAWQEVVAASIDGATKDAVSQIATVLDAGTGQNADIARIGLAGAQAFSVPLHPSTKAMLEKHLDVDGLV